MSWKPNHIYLEPMPEPILAEVKTDFLERRWVRFVPNEKPYMIPEIEYQCRYLKMTPPREGRGNRVNLFHLFMRLGTLTPTLARVFLGYGRSESFDIFHRLVKEGICEEIHKGHFRLAELPTRTRMEGMSLDEYLEWREQNKNKIDPKAQLRAEARALLMGLGSNEFKSWETKAAKAVLEDE